MMHFLKKPRVVLLAAAACVMPACFDTVPMGEGAVDTDTDAGTDTDIDVDTELQWIPLIGGSFQMGSDAGEDNELPVHSVTVNGFEILKTEVTVAQYAKCVESDVCNPLDFWGYCNTGYMDKMQHPQTCVWWYDAEKFCDWVGGRLPSEAEWEWAARSAGQNILYPWGDEVATCDYVVMLDEGYGCGMDDSWPVCSKPIGNTAQGLCDMSGNAKEWVRDWYHDNYTGAPTDGNAWEEPIGSERVTRGGSIASEPYDLRATSRTSGVPVYTYINIGFRCAKGGEE